MKQIFRCEYCDKIGVAEEIAKHEEECIHNYTKRSCMTCEYKELQGIHQVICKAGKEIARDCIIEHCGNYNWDAKDHTTRNPVAANNLFGGIFGL